MHTSGKSSQKVLEGVTYKITDSFCVTVFALKQGYFWIKRVGDISVFV